MRNKLFLFLICISLNLTAQTGEWVWLKGPSISLTDGNYGIKGIADSANYPSGTWESVNWTDKNGNFWMFGGLRRRPFFGYLSDLWKYNPISNQWTWMHGNNLDDDTGSYGTKGIASPSNLPEARCYGSATWVDNQGNLWMYGGEPNQGNGAKDDLWKFDIITNEWIWINGSASTGAIAVYGIQGVSDSSNTPGERGQTHASWSDSLGNFYMFGGRAVNSKNDMWRYNISLNQWTWLKGPQGADDHGYYGSKGVESSLNNPSGRYVYSKWTDKDGNFWIFGGLAYNGDEMNDMWRYNPYTNNWTWMSGDSVGLSLGVYGAKCNSTPYNKPSARSFSTSTWVDKRGNLWLYSGGYGFSSITGANDLWMYCISTNEWSWMKGDSALDTPGNWGTMGVSSPTNIPNARGTAMSWSSNNGDLYLFGGSGPGTFELYNDLWKFVIDTTCASCSMITSATEINNEQVVIVYPNPAEDYLYIKLSNDVKTVVTLFDLNGRMVSSNVTFNSTDEIKMDLSNINPGIYYLQLKSSLGTRWEKVILL